MAKAAPHIPTKESIYEEHADEGVPQKRWNCGSTYRFGESKKTDIPEQNNLSVGQNPQPGVGPATQSVAEIIKKFQVESAKDQSKPLMAAPYIPTKESYEEHADEGVPQKRWNCGSTYKCGEGKKTDIPEQNNLSVGQNPQPGVGPATQSVAEIIKKFPVESAKDQSKPLIGEKGSQPLVLQGRMKMLIISSMDDKKKKKKDFYIIKDADCLMEWWENIKSWEYFSNKHARKGEEELFTLKAERILNAVQLYNLLLNTHGETLKNHIMELYAIADNFDKFSKGTKIAGITGGATGAVGGAAAVAGVLFAPVTFGASLALTVLGVGVAAAGGVTGASAAIANKVSHNNDKNKIELNLQYFQAQFGDIEACLTFINVGMEYLKRHDLSVLKWVNTETLRVSKVAEVTGLGTTRAIKASSKASGNLEGFALGMGMYFSNKKNNKGEQKLKNKLVSEFGRKIRELARQLDEGLKELFKVKADFIKNNLIF
uniref:Apolipoprotein L, 1 n=1 Tax=Esox lucius TaxID=8010 RepID=A0A3P8YYS5_ESOLU